MIEQRMPVLMYHGLHARAQDHGRFDSVYSVHPTEFERQLDWLQAHDYHSVRLDGADDAVGERRVVISFDDGEVSNRDVALPLLAARGMVAEFFITSDFVGQPGMLSRQDVRALADAGMAVQSHGRTHRFLEDLDEAALESELIESKRELETIGGTAITALALPGGRGGNRERHAALRLGYRHVLNSVPGVNRAHRANDYYERLAITRDLTLADFAALLEWRGLRPRAARIRYHALMLPKRLLGNERYQRLRARLLAR